MCKDYTKCIQKSYKTLNMYIFCIQNLHKSKFQRINDVQPMYKNFLLTKVGGWGGGYGGEGGGGGHTFLKITL